MVETITYSLIGAQDIRFSTDTFEVTLADGRVVVLEGVRASHIPSASGGDVEDYIAGDIVPARRGLTNLLQDFDQNSATTTGLTWGYKSGIISTGTVQAAGTVTLTASATNYVELTPGTGAVTANTSGFTAGRVPLRLITTSATAILTSADRRPWFHVPAVATATTGSYRVTGADCRNNSSTPDTQYDLDADVIVLRNTSNEIVVRHAPGAAITNNVSTSGPAANGRDQSGAFTASTFIHFYWIWNPTTETLATVSSATGPPTGPTLPSGYTYWCYATSVYFSSGSALVKTRTKGAWAIYEAKQSAVSNGTGTTEQTVSLTALVPSIALMIQYLAESKLVAGGVATDTCKIRLVSGTDFLILPVGSAANEGHNMAFLAPQISQQVFYINVTTGNAPELDLDVLGYMVPNAGE